MYLRVRHGGKGESNRGPQLTRSTRFRNRRRVTRQPSSAPHENCPKLPRMRRRIPGTSPRAMNSPAVCASQWCQPSRRSSTMRNRLLAIAAIAGVLGVPLAAQAQTVGIVRGESVIVDDDGGLIAVDQRPAFREYIVRERVPSYTIPERVIVGGVLPEAGVTYYDVPQTFGATPYRYTVVNGQTVLVEPRTPPHRSGRGVTRDQEVERSRARSNDLNDQSGRRASGCARERPDKKAPPGLPPPGGAFLLRSSCPGRGAALCSACTAEPGPSIARHGLRLCSASLRAAQRPGNADSILYLRKIRHRARRRADFVQQLQPVLAHLRRRRH